MLANSLRPEHGMRDFSPVALFHTRRMKKVSAKIDAQHKLMEQQLAMERARKAEEAKRRKEEKERQEMFDRMSPQELEIYNLQQLQNHQLQRLRGYY